MRVLFKLFPSTLIFFTTSLQDPENPSNELIVDMDIKVRIVCKTKELRFSTIYMYFSNVYQYISHCKKYIFPI